MTLCVLAYLDNYSWEIWVLYMWHTGWSKSRFIVVSLQRTEFILILIFIHYCTEVIQTTVNLLLPHPAYTYFWEIWDIYVCKLYISICKFSKNKRLLITYVSQQLNKLKAIIRKTVVNCTNSPYIPEFLWHCPWYSQYLALY